MDGAEEPINKVDYLARSTTRVRLLEALYEHGTLEKSELKDRVDASRTTIQRNLDALEEEGWIRDDNCEYWITRSGEPVAEQFLNLLETVHVADRFAPLLKWLPAESFDLDIRSLANADLTVATRGDPYAPANRHVEFMRSADPFRCLLPAVALQPMLVARDCIVERGHTHEIVVDEDVAETLSTDRNYREPLTDVVESERCEIFVADRTVPFYLGLANDTVQIGVGDDDETPKGLAESTASDVWEWAKRTYADFRAGAKRFEPQWATPETV